MDYTLFAGERVRILTNDKKIYEGLVWGLIFKDESEKEVLEVWLDNDTIEVSEIFEIKIITKGVTNVDAMADIKIHEVPVLEPEIKINKAAQHKLINEVQEESQVIVHGTYSAPLGDKGIRIWKSTFLFDIDSKHKSTLVFVEKITMYPDWMLVNMGETAHFTLIFSGLPKHCKRFNLIEKIPKSGGFDVRNIQRNKTDIYSLDLS